MLTVISGIGLLLAIALLIWLVFKGFDAIWLTIIAVGVLCLTSWLNFKEQWLSIMMSQAGNMFANVGSIILTSLLFAGIFSISGAAKSVARTLLNVAERIFKPKPGHEAQTGIWVTVILLTVVGSVFAVFGLDGMAVQVILLPIALQMIKKYNINRKVLPSLLYANACMNCLPFSMNSSMIMLANGLGVSTGVAPLSGILGCLAGTVFTVLWLVWYMNRSLKKGEVFQASPTDAEVPDEVKLPHFVLAIIPLILTFVLYTFFDIAMPIAMLITTVLACLMYLPQLRTLAKVHSTSTLKFIGNSLNSSAKNAAYIVTMVVLLVGYAFVIQSTPAFGAIVSALTNASSSALMWTCALCMTISVGLSCNPVAGMLTNLKVVAPHFMQAGLSNAFLMRIGMTTSAILNTLPTNTAVMMAHKISDVKMKDGYLGVFMVTCVAPAIMTLVELLVFQFGYLG